MKELVTPEVNPEPCLNCGQAEPTVVIKGRDTGVCQLCWATALAAMARYDSRDIDRLENEGGYVE